MYNAAAPNLPCGPLKPSYALQEFMEYGKILTEEDFERIRKLRHRKMVEAVMKKHGLKSASKRERLLTEAEEEAEEAIIEQVPASHSAPACIFSCPTYRHVSSQRSCDSRIPACKGVPFGQQSSNVST